MSESFEQEQASGCDHNCSGCSASCGSRQSEQTDFRETLNQYSTVKKVIGVVSGKGGVGKSFLTSYLAVLLNRRGYRVGVLDADITGPSVPRAFGVREISDMSDLGIVPAQTESGIEIMSLNLIIDDEEQPVVWRGPVIAGTVRQFWSEVFWGDLDVMLVDMPPGTGDVPLTVYQSLPVDGVLVATSPQELVSMIVGKAVNMAKMMNIPILGVVENYSYVECGNCGEKISVFGESHIDRIAGRYGLPVLSRIPIRPEIAHAMDQGSIETLQGDWLDLAADTITSMPERQ